MIQDVRVRHVLFDTDGVVQQGPSDWHAALEPYVGERTREFLRATWTDELPSLRGEGDYLPLLAERLIEYGVATPVETCSPTSGSGSR
jgi:putative hydrolase of the HAD superfamily